MVGHDPKTDYYERLGDKFEAYMSDYDVERRLQLIFSDLIARDDIEGRSILEIGSGTGRFSGVIQELGGRVTVLDIGANLVTTVAEQLRCNGVVGDTLRLPFTDGAFHLIVSSECVEHTFDPARAIKEMCRVSAPGGAVCVTTPNKLWYPAMRLSQTLGLRKYDGIENWLWPGRAAAVMRSSGMMGVRLSGCHLWPFQLKFTRPLLRQLDNHGRRLYPLMVNFGVMGRKAQREVL